MRLLPLGLAVFLIPLNAAAETLTQKDAVKATSSLADMGSIGNDLQNMLDLNSSPLVRLLDSDRHSACVLKLRVAQVQSFDGLLQLANSTNVAVSMKLSDDKVVASQNVAFEARFLLSVSLLKAKDQIVATLAGCKDFSDVAYQARRLISAIDADTVVTQNVLDKVADVPAKYTGGHSDN